MVLKAGWEVGGNLRLVDYHRHTALAMFSLGLCAIQPDWIRVIDADGEGSAVNETGVDAAW